MLYHKIRLILCEVDKRLACFSFFVFMSLVLSRWKNATEILAQPGIIFLQVRAITNIETV